MPILTPSADDFYRVMPELIWCSFGILLMLLQPLTKSRNFLGTVAFLGAAAGTASSYLAYQHLGPGFFSLIRSDAFSFFLHLLVGLVAVLVVLASDSYLSREKLDSAEFYALILFATAGMGVLSSAQELLTAFIGLEMSSISSYILAGYRRGHAQIQRIGVEVFSPRLLRDGILPLWHRSYIRHHRHDRARRHG
jgi:NADH-quinone oxidoreductase subunit N